jgi:hypothetical protein
MKIGQSIIDNLETQVLGTTHRQAKHSTEDSKDEQQWPPPKNGGWTNFKSDVLRQASIHPSKGTNKW